MVVVEIIIVVMDMTSLRKNGIIWEILNGDASHGKVVPNSMNNYIKLGFDDIHIIIGIIHSNYNVKQSMYSSITLYVHIQIIQLLQLI